MFIGANLGLGGSLWIGFDYADLPEEGIQVPEEGSDFPRFDAVVSTTALTSAES